MARYLFLGKQENNFVWDLVGHKAALMWDFRAHLESRGRTLGKVLLHKLFSLDP